ncbi:hypothetical protein J6590_100977, partial [Homalodisca vitripennis]
VTMRLHSSTDHLRLTSVLPSSKITFKQRIDSRYGPGTSKQIKDLESLHLKGQSSVLNMIRRAEICIQVGGSHFEQRL